MNFTQMHERLRQELLRRIQRGTLSVSLLARQSGLGQPHLSNFLRARRQLSLQALDRVLACQHLSAADFLPAPTRAEPFGVDHEFAAIPVVSHGAAIADPFIRPVAGQEMLHVPARRLESLQARPPGNRRAWERFVAVRVDEVDALPMDPLLLPGAIALLDRHYNSLAPYRPDRRNLYAVRQGAHLILRHAEILSGRLVLRPHNVAFSVELIDVDSGASAQDFLAGRVAMIFNET
jgi:hypothetical protein